MSKATDAAKAADAAKADGAPAAQEGVTFGQFIKSQMEGVPPQDQASLIRVQNAADDFSRQLKACLEYDLPEVVKTEIENFLEIL